MTKIKNVKEQWNKSRINFYETKNNVIKSLTELSFQTLLLEKGFNEEFKPSI